MIPLCDQKDLVGLSESKLAALDIGYVNLVCASGLRGAKNLDIPSYVERLNDWASLVDYGTKRMFPKFDANPEEFNNSEAYFRMLIMVTVLQRNLGVTYNPDCREGDGDFRDSRVQFIHGLLDGYGGTCASMPVLYIAIGRRLGYALKLVRTKQHLFARWEGAGERLNIAGSNGIACHPDEYYHNFPIPLSEKDLREKRYLYSFTPRQELACFLVGRGVCLLYNMRWMEAAEAFYHACQLDPKNDDYNAAWAEATIIENHCTGLIDYGLRRDSSVDRPLDQWEEVTIPDAKRTLASIESLHQQEIQKEIYSNSGDMSCMTQQWDVF